MFHHVVDRVRKKRDKKRSYRIHFIAFYGYDLDSFLALFNECYPIEDTYSHDATHTTITVTMRPSELKTVLLRLSHDVAVSYEEL